eukprot:TRINITY_DN3947_c0_g1_i1.p1 TRINITY_DN3947_c0_g1~~TRINITY_DN3947_c0_g1_i1.p1  ORF type:complete len:351 (-),score=51.13 TRINITY_DN3947_c0_g1_i1:40-1092(-)
MILMYTSAVRVVRSPVFEIFWFTHHLYILFYGLILLHGCSAVLEPPTFWIWFVFPGMVYLIERTVRVMRGSQSTIVLQAIAHPSRVLELRMRKPQFLYIPGQYVFLSCPYIANFEWHPFTISSSPDEEFMSCHIRIIGDWTGKLWELLNPDGVEGIVQEHMVTAPNGSPIIMIDGPYGAASEEVFGFDTVILFAAGIGVTPFASILKAIKHMLDVNPDQCRIQRVHFYWSNRDSTAFEWFIWLLAYLEQTCDFLDINLFFTGNLTPDQVRAAHHGGDLDHDAITGLNAKTTFARPVVKNIIQQKAQEYQGQRVGVFFCGPPVISKLLYDACTSVTNAREGTRFIYHKENF